MQKFINSCTSLATAGGLSLIGSVVLMVIGKAIDRHFFRVYEFFIWSLTGISAALAIIGSMIAATYYLRQLAAGRK